MEPESSTTSVRSITVHPEGEKGSESYVWSISEDECPSDVRKRALRDQRVALMLKEMRTAMHNMPSVTTAPELSQSSGYSSVTSYSLRPHQPEDTYHGDMMDHSCTASPHRPEDMYRGSKADHSYDRCSDEMLPASFGNQQVSTATCGCDSNDEETPPLTQSLERLRVASSSHSGSLSRNSYYKCFGDEYTLGSCDQDMSNVSEATALMDTTLSTMWSGSELESLNEDSSSYTPGSRHSSSSGSTQPRFASDVGERLEEVRRRSIDVLRKLKRRSAAWNGPGVSVTRSESVTAWLKEGRESAQRKQEVIEELLSEASSQLRIQQQASVALRLCGGQGSLEEVEAERLILLAGERYKAFRGEAQDLVLELRQMADNPSEEALQPCTATLFLSDLRMTLTREFLRKLTFSDCATHHFLCLVREMRTQGITATQTISITRGDHSLEFSNRFTLPNIPHNFEIVLEIYHLGFEQCSKTRTKKFSQVFKSAKRISSLRKSKATRCLVCTQSVSTVSLTGSPPAQSPESPLQSRFKLVGKASITRSTLRQETYHVKQATNEEVVMIDAVKATTFADPILVSEPIQGYLNMFCATGCWERRWFALMDSSLCCWLYPDEPGRSEKALRHWDLSSCDQSAHPASPTTCAWQHSFVIPVPSLLQNSAGGLLLSAESQEESTKWIHGINYMILSTLTWQK